MLVSVTSRYVDGAVAVLKLLLTLKGLLQQLLACLRLGWFRRSLPRMYDDYYFFVGQWMELCAS